MEKTTLALTYKIKVSEGTFSAVYNHYFTLNECWIPAYQIFLNDQGHAFKEDRTRVTKRIKGSGQLIRVPVSLAEDLSRYVCMKKITEKEIKAFFENVKK